MGMMIDDAQGCNEAGEKLYSSRHRAIEGELERRQANTRRLSPSRALNIKSSLFLSSPPSHLTMATAVTTHTSAFSFTAPFPSSSGPKQRRVSLATPASEREVPAFKFRDDTSLPSPSPSDERRGKVRRLTSPAPQEKKARKKWTMEETQMLVEGCNRVSTLPPFRHPTVG
jgi:hypothetical protein